MSKVLVFAALAMAVVLLFSCTDIDVEKDALSSSSEILYNYCVYPEAEECFSGSYSICLGGGVPSNECPYSSSSGDSSSSGEDISSDSSLPSSASPSSSSFFIPSSSSSVDSPSSNSGGEPSSSNEESPSSNSEEPNSSGESSPSSNSEEPSSSSSDQLLKSSSSASVLLCMFNTTIVTVGVKIDLTGVVTCNGSNVSPSSVSWSGATASWFNNPTPTGTKTNITVTANCGGSSKTADCADIEVRGGTSSGSGGDCSRSGWCDYDGGNCHQMPTDDCCKDGTLVANQAACSTASSTEYCNYGECKGGSGWDCEYGGGCYVKKASDTCSGGSTVKTCPKGTCPPNADYCAK